MATQLQLRRGTNAQVTAFTGAEGEVSINTTNDSLHVHDGSSAGGFELARVDGSNWAITNAISTTANISFGDNDKAIFGAGSDLQIYHDGSHSFISDQGTGNLRLLAENFQVQNAAGNEAMIVAVPNAGVALYYNSNSKLTTTSAGIDVTGTLTADGLTVEGGNTIRLNASSTNDFLTLTQNGTQAVITADSDATGSLVFQTTAAGSSADRLEIAAGGDISFYEDTGTTPKLFWDASAESLGIGTSSPTSKLAISGSSAFTVGNSGKAIQGIDITATAGGNNNFGGAISFGAGGAGRAAIATVQNSTDNDNIGLAFFTHTSTSTDDSIERLRIDSSGNVGIGSADAVSYGKFLVNGTGNLINANASSGAATFQLYEAGAGRFGITTLDGSAGAKFTTAGTERMRIDASGNLLVGKSAIGFSNAGFEARASGTAYITASGAQPLVLNRKSSDGDIVSFYKDGAAVGSIGSLSGTQIVIDSGGNRSGVRFEDNGLLPRKNSAMADGTVTLGNASYRFSDLYLSNYVKVPANRGIRSDGALYLQSNASATTKSAYLNTSGDFVFGTSTQGIYLGGTSSANKLDDYEEGTFGANLRGSTSEPATLVSATGYYTKIGRTVTYNISFENKTTTGYSGAVYVTGLPFANNFGRHVGTAAVYSLASWTDNVAGIINLGATSIDLMDIRSGNGWATATHNAGSTRYLWLSGTYMTTA